MQKIKKGDTVQIIAGKDKGQEGKVVSVNPSRRSQHGDQAYKAFSG